MWYLRFLYWLGVSPVKLSDKYYPEYKWIGYTMSRHRAVYSYPDIPILLFAKAPELGKVKTRLAKVLDELEILSLDHLEPHYKEDLDK